MNPISVIAAVLLSVAQPLDGWVDVHIPNGEKRKSLARFLDYPACFKTSAFTLETPVLNPDFWLKDIDFSCASPWNSGAGRFRAGTAISKRHVVFANHFPLWKGVRILFVGSDGGVCPCTVEAVRRVGNSDIMVGLLNAELTPNIHPAKILPADYERHLGAIRGAPVISFNQNEEVFLHELNEVPTNAVPSARFRSTWTSHPVRRQMSGNIVKGDSGNPAFMIFGNQPILVYCLFGGGPGSGYALHMYSREIQKVMDELCPGYKLEEFDFKMLKGKLK